MNEQMIYKVVDMDMDEFKAMCADKDMSYLRGLENLFNVIYNNLVKIQGRLNRKIENAYDATKFQELLPNLEIKMINVAGKIYSLRDMQKERDDRVEANLKKTNQDI